MELNIENKGVIARIDRVEDYLENKLCKVVISVKYNTEIDGQVIPSSFNIVEGFTYSETWEDSEIIKFAEEKANKRLNDISTTDLVPETRASIKNNLQTDKEAIVISKPGLLKRIIQFFKK